MTDSNDISALRRIRNERRAGGHDTTQLDETLNLLRQFQVSGAPVAPVPGIWRRWLNIGGATTPGTDILDVVELLRARLPAGETCTLCGDALTEPVGMPPALLELYQAGDASRLWPWPDEMIVAFAWRTIDGEPRWPCDQGRRLEPVHALELILYALDFFLEERSLRPCTTDQSFSPGTTLAWHRLPEDALWSLLLYKDALQQDDADDETGSPGAVLRKFRERIETFVAGGHVWAQEALQFILQRHNDADNRPEDGTPDALHKLRVDAMSYMFPVSWLDEVTVNSSQIAVEVWLLHAIVELEREITEDERDRIWGSIHRLERAAIRADNADIIRQIIEMYRTMDEHLHDEPRDLFDFAANNVLRNAFWPIARYVIIELSQSGDVRFDDGIDKFINYTHGMHYHAAVMAACIFLGKSEKNVDTVMHGIVNVIMSDTNYTRTKVAEIYLHAIDIIISVEQRFVQQHFFSRSILLLKHFSLLSAANANVLAGRRTVDFFRFIMHLPFAGHVHVELLYMIFKHKYDNNDRFRPTSCFYTETLAPANPGDILPLFSLFVWQGHFDTIRDIPALFTSLSRNEKQDVLAVAMLAELVHPLRSVQNVFDEIADICKRHGVGENCDIGDVQLRILDRLATVASFPYGLQAVEMFLEKYQWARDGFVGYQLSMLLEHIIFDPVTLFPMGARNLAGILRQFEASVMREAWIGQGDGRYATDTALLQHIIVEHEIDAFDIFLDSFYRIWKAGNVEDQFLRMMDTVLYTILRVFYGRRDMAERLVNSYVYKDIVTDDFDSRLVINRAPEQIRDRITQMFAAAAQRQSLGERRKRKQ